MAIVDVTQFFLYRWRYILGYGAVALLLIGMLIFAGLAIPGGLSDQEMGSVVTSESLSFTQPESWAIANAPFYWLQSIIFSVFGVTIFTIKLPSLILALVSAVGLILLLRRWFKPNIAVLTSLIAVSTGQFLFIAQQGAPGILYVFWPIVLLLLGTQITRGKRLRLLWKFLFAASVALSLYTPLSIYPLIAILLAIVLHPHLRNAVRQLSKFKITLVVLVALAILAPLAYSIWLSPWLGLTLLGVPTAWPPDFLANAVTVLRQYFLFWEPSATTLMTPVFGLGSALLIILGLYRLIRTRETTRSYLIIIWILCLIPVLLFNPNFTSVTFVPSVLLLAAGLMSLISYWYRLFPRNPYARVAGLIPLVVLVVALIGSGMTRYIYGYYYSPSVAPLFSHDLALLPKGTVELIVSDEEKPFYAAVGHYRGHRDLTVVSTPTTEEFVVTQQANRDFPGYGITQIITDKRAEGADRFYVYKKVE